MLIFKELKFRGRIEVSPLIYLFSGVERIKPVNDTLGLIHIRSKRFHARLLIQLINIYLSLIHLKSFNKEP